jgi:hypothetical protein
MGAIDELVGVLFIGIVFNTFLYGLVCYQFLIYYTSKHKDPLWIRLVVGTLFTIDTVHTSVGIYAGYETCVTNYGNPASLEVVTWTIPFLAIATATAAIITQIFLSHRVYYLTKSKPLIGAIMMISSSAFILAVYAGVRAIQVKELSNFGELIPPVMAWLALQTTSDWIITIVLTAALMKSRTGFHRTDSVIHRLVRGAIQTGLFASIFALGDLCTFKLHVGTNLYAMFAYPIGRIYTNTLMDTLNARSEFRDMLNRTVDLDSESNANAIRMQSFLARPKETYESSMITPAETTLSTKSISSTQYSAPTVFISQTKEVQ